MKKYQYLCLLLVSTLSASFSALAAENAAEESRSAQGAGEASVSGGGATQGGRAANAPVLDDNAVQLPALTVTADQILPTASQMYRERISDYRVERSTSATKTNTPLIETPMSIQVVPQGIIEDRQYTNVLEAMENVSGVVATPSASIGSRYLIRGFQQDRIYRNGLISNGLNARFPSSYDTATIEHIEVIKGPASVLYGRIEPGGFINIVTKKPLPFYYHNAEVQLGSFDYSRAVVDSTGPIDEDGTWLYRIIGNWQRNDTFKDFGQDDRWLIAPSLTWQPTEATDFRVSLEYFHRDFQAVLGWPVIGDRPVRLPRSRTLTMDPNDPEDELERLQIGTEFNHRFNDNWTLRNRFLFGRIENDDIWINPAPCCGNADALQADGRTLNRNIYGQVTETYNYATNLDLLGHIKLGFTEHQILVGFAYLRGRTHYVASGDFLNPNPALAIDIFNPGPSYGIDPALFETTLATAVFPNNHAVFKDHDFGVYFQDHITIWENLHLLFSGRYDWIHTGRGRAKTEDEAVANVAERNDEGFSPRVALLYQFLPTLSGYASWSRSFGTNNGLSATGKTFDPERGEQYEVGLKAKLFDQRLFATVAVYHLTKSNLLTPNLSTPDDLRDSIAVGEQRSQGVEVELSGRVTEQLSLSTGYAYTDTEVTQDNSGFEGSEFAQVPQHAVNFWGRYDFAATSPLSGLTLGFGGVAISDRPGDLANTFTLPGYVRLDAMAAYHFRLGGSLLTARINVRNLTDKYYYASTAVLNVSPRQGVLVGAPRTVIGAIELKF